MVIGGWQPFGYIYKGQSHYVSQSSEEIKLGNECRRVARVQYFGIC